MKVLVIGASGIIGKAVSQALTGDHEVIEASRSGAVRVDLGDRESINAMYQGLGRVDAVICTAGQAAFGPLGELHDADFEEGLRNKLMGQIYLVRLGMPNLNDRGSFTLISGLWGRDPMPGASVIAPVNAGIEGFARAAALELPRGIRINVVSPPLVRETSVAMGLGEHGMPASEVASAFVKLLTGTVNGTTLFPGD